VDNIDDCSTSGHAEGSLPATNHRTSSRDTDRHIVQTLGIAPCRREDIANEASQKRAIKRSIKDKKVTSARIQAEKEAAGIEIASQLVQEYMDNDSATLLNKTALATVFDEEDHSSMGSNNGNGNTIIDGYSETQANINSRAVSDV
jgi:hypothetical protein